MKKHNPSSASDLEICKAKVIAILAEYNCSIHDVEGYGGCYIKDNDTDQTSGFP